MRLRPTNGISIEWQDLFLIVVACTLWFPHFSGKRIQVWCDNELVVVIINSGHSKTPRIMDLLRFLVLLSMKHNSSLSGLTTSLGSLTTSLIASPAFRTNVTRQWLQRHKKIPYHSAFTNDPLTEEVQMYAKLGLAGLPTVLMCQVKKVLFSFAFQTGLCLRRVTFSQLRKEHVFCLINLARTVKHGIIKLYLAAVCNLHSSCGP